MIQTTFPEFLAAIVTLFLAGVFALWVLSEMVRRNSSKHAARHRVSCGLCGTHFEDTSTAELVECPRCGRLNERVSDWHDLMER